LSEGFSPCIRRENRRSSSRAIRCHNIETISQRDQKKISRRRTCLEALQNKLSRRENTKIAQGETLGKAITNKPSPVGATEIHQFLTSMRNPQKHYTAQRQHLGETSSVTTARLQPGHQSDQIKNQGFSPCKHLASVVNPEKHQRRITLFQMLPVGNPEKYQGMSLLMPKPHPKDPGFSPGTR
jgi:hypothetical protein